MKNLRTLMLAAITLLLLAFPFTNLAQTIKSHQTSGEVNLVPGEPRGTITQPLLTGTIASTGQEVLFVITDASDKDFAEMFGTIRADALDEAPAAAVEDAIFNDGDWTFFNDPGFVTRFDGDGNVIAPVSNPNYSPMKRFMWNDKLVTVNVPFIKWGDDPGQQLLIEDGGCDPLIRSNPPSPFFVANGPTNGADCSDEDPLERYKGGQVVALDLDEMTVTMKLHIATFDHPNVFPYYTVFEASKKPPAGFMGVIHAPKLGNIGRFGDNDAVGRIAQFSNGIRINPNGPNRFQQGITSYKGGQSQTYSPMWHITWIFFDCDEDGVFFNTDRNVGEGASPAAGSGIPKFDPANPATFDPFGMDDKGVNCPDFAAEVTGNADGFIEDLNHLNKLIEEGSVIQTEGPAGLRLNSTLQPPLIVNCPVPVTVTGMNKKGSNGDMVNENEGANEGITINIYPNPFKDQATFKFSIPQDDHVTLEIYNMIGEKVATLFNGMVQENTLYGVEFSMDNLESGVYFYNLKTKDEIFFNRLILLR